MTKPNCSYIVLGLLVTGILALSFTVPVEHPKISSVFGESRGDHIHNGVDFYGDGQTVKAVLPGDVLFFWQNSDHPLEQMFGYGNYMILSHPDGVLSFYYHLKDGSIDDSLLSVSEGYPIALTGNSGHSSGAHLHFTLSYPKENRIINPLLMMRDLKDTIKPRIEGVYWSPAGRTNLHKLHNNAIFSQCSRIELFVKAWDLRNETSNLMGIYRLETFTNGHKMLNLEFNYEVHNSFEGSVLYPGLTHDDIYLAPYIYKLGNISRCRQAAVDLKVIVSDLDGNTATDDSTLEFIK